MTPENTNVPFPRHDIDPREKGKDWILQAGKAIWANYKTGMPLSSIFYSKALRYSEIRDYALNKQSINKYKKWQTGEENPDTAFFNIDQSTEAIVKTHRQKILGRLKKIAYNIMATPIDPLAKGKLDDYFAEKKMKIMLRQAIMQQAPELANHPMVAKESGEADDIEELEMQMEFSPKFIRAKEAEQGIGMIFYENDMDTLLDLADEDLVDFGVAVFKEGMDNNNRVTYRHGIPGAFICSNSRDGMFNDLSYAGELYEVPLSQIAHLFKKEQMEEIANLAKGKNGNPAYLGIDGHLTRGYDAFKVTVFDFEIKSYDRKVTQEKKNRRGNLKFNLTKFSADPNQKTYSGEGEKEAIESKDWENVYKGKWIVGTEYIYEYGLATNQKRTINKKKMSKTSLSYLVVASSFDKMVAKGITEDLIPVADELQMTVLKLRNLNNRMIINGLAIDFSALEGVALGGTGEKALTPEENLDMLFQIGIVGYRSDLIIQDGKNQRKPVEPLILDYANQFTALWNNYTNNVNKLYEISGLNQTTDSATVNPKTLVGVANAQNMGTNNALFFVENARRRLVVKMAKEGIQRLQAALLLGPYEGYTQTLGKTSIEFMRFEEMNLPYDYDIIIEDKATAEDKQIMYQSVQADIAAGVLDSSDVLTLMNTFNLKDAEMILAHKAKKNREMKQQQSIQLQQANTEAQSASLQNAENEKRKTLQMQSQLKQQEIVLGKQWDYQIKELEMGIKTQHVDSTNATKIAQTVLAGQQQGAGEETGEPVTPQEAAAM